MIRRPLSIRRRPVNVEGTIYPSAAEASRVTGIQISKIHRGLRKQLYSYA